RTNGSGPAHSENETRRRWSSSATYRSGRSWASFSPDHLDPAKSRGSGGMGHPAGLSRLPLAARNEPVPPAKRSISHSVATVPKLRRDPMVNHVPHHVSSPAVFNQPECVTAELKIVAALIDAVGPMAFDINAAFHIGHELITRRLAGLQSDIGNSYDRNIAPSVSAVGATRTRFVDLRRHFTARTVADEHSVADDVPSLAHHSIIVIAGRGQRFRF